MEGDTGSLVIVLKAPHGNPSALAWRVYSMVLRFQSIERLEFLLEATAL